MVCTNRYTKPKRGLRGAAGMTIVELVVAMAVGLIVLTAAVGFLIYTGRSFAGMMNYTELEDQSRMALDKMLREMRTTCLLTSYTSNKISLRDSDGTTLSYEYSPTAKTLVRAKDGVTNTLLTGCDFMNFSIYQRTPISNSFSHYTATMGSTNCKLVQVSWVCSRSITGTKLNTESVQTAKVVLRNKP